MSFIEFLEATCRAIYKASPAPPRDPVEEGEEEDEENVMSVVDRKA
jgi:hypothetical protein